MPVEEEATLVEGLPKDSRIMQRLGKSKISLQEALLAAILDELRILNWSRTKDAKKKRNVPTSILEELTREPNAAADKDELQTFDSGDELKARLEQIRGENNGD